MLEAGTAFVLPGNHEEKLARALDGADVRIANGIDRSLEQLEDHPELAARMVALHPTLADHLLLDGGRLVVAHAGLEEAFHGRESRRVQVLALFGPTDPDIWFPYRDAGPYQVLARAPHCHPCDLHDCPAFICLPELEPGPVWDALVSLLENSAGDRGDKA